MKIRGRSWDLLWAVLLLLIPTLFLYSNLRQPAKLNPIDRVVLAVSSPLQRLVAWSISGVGRVTHGYVWLVDVEEENRELRSENDRLATALAQAQRTAAQVKELERLVELRKNTLADTVGARVVSAGVGPYFRTSRLMLEGPGELTPGMAVLSADGLVGRVRRAWGNYADVVLAVDPDSSVDVVVPRVGSRGVLKGLGGENWFRAKIDYLVRTDEVQVGDLVVTSGLGGTFPRGIPVGRIEAVRRQDHGLYQEIDIAPAVDFRNLSHVLVVLAAPPPPDPGAAEPAKRATARAAFGVVPFR